MFKTVLCSAGFLVLMTGCDVRKKDKQATIATTPAEVKDPTSIQLIDSVYDFGKVTEGEIVEYSYRFKNTGDKPLVVSEVHASCGCTVPEKPEKPILPGEIGYLKVVFDSKGKAGHVEKSITVSSNANPEFPTLLLRGEINKTK